jgi:RNA polymerase sigma factor for flagellar operon FliA
VPDLSTGWIVSKKTARSCIGWQDKEERDRILLERLPLVRYLARQIHERLPVRVPLEDLMHAGIIGLIDALNKFDHSKQVKFGAYARFRIRGAIIDSLRAMDWGTRTLRRKAREIEEAKRKLSTQLSRVPTDVEIAQMLKVDLLKFQRLLTELDGLEVVSLSAGSPWDDEGQELADCLPSPCEDTPFLVCLRSERKRILAGVIAELPEKEQQILALYYCDELTMKEVGAVMGIGESRVSQILSLALASLRQRLGGLMSPATPSARAAQVGGN